MLLILSMKDKLILHEEGQHRLSLSLQYEIKHILNKIKILVWVSVQGRTSPSKLGGEWTHKGTWLNLGCIKLPVNICVVGVFPMFCPGSLSSYHWNTLAQTLPISDSYVSVSKKDRHISVISTVQNGDVITSSYSRICCPFYASKSLHHWSIVN